MPSSNRRLAMKWHLHHPNTLPMRKQVVVRYSTIHTEILLEPAGRPVSERIPAKDQPLNFAIRATLFLGLHSPGYRSTNTSSACRGVTGDCIECNALRPCLSYSQQQETVLCDLGWLQRGI